ncbi:MAG: DUF2062 domain-containing protein [Sneathiella sp.]
MFQRRNKTPKVRQVANFFWPSIGFKRSTRYMSYRLARMPGSPYSLAAGFAFGAAVSFTPFVGLHFIVSGLLAWIFRANILASAIGTVVGNPWTFPFIWTAVYNLGFWMLDLDSLEGQTFTAHTMKNFFHDFWDSGWQSVSEIFMNILFPMFVGSAPISVVVWILIFYPLWVLIKKFRVKRAEAHQAARERLEQARSSLAVDTTISRGKL